jgi:hypothetical protein
VAEVEVMLVTDDVMTVGTVEVVPSSLRQRTEWP